MVFLIIPSIEGVKIVWIEDLCRWVTVAPSSEFSLQSGVSGWNHNAASKPNGGVRGRIWKSGAMWRSSRIAPQNEFDSDWDGSIDDNAELSWSLDAICTFERSLMPLCGTKNSEKEDKLVLRFSFTPSCKLNANSSFEDVSITATQKRCCAVMNDS